MKKLIPFLCLLQITLISSAQLWGPLPTAPGGGGYGSFSIDTLSYLYCGSNHLYSYSGTTNAWTQKATCPAALINLYGCVSFAAGNYGCIGESWNDYYRYDPIANTWTRMPNYPDSTANYFMGFSAGGLGYVGDSKGKLYEYDAGSNAWIPKANWPVALGSNIGFGTGLGNLAYVYCTSSGVMWQYNTTSDSWSSLATTYTNPNSAGGFISNDTVYCISNDTVRIFSIASNSWSHGTACPQPACDLGGYVPTFYNCFVLGNKNYVSVTSCDNSFWTFDPDHYFKLVSVSPDTICSGGPVSFVFSTNVSFGIGNNIKLQNASADLIFQDGTNYSAISDSGKIANDTVVLYLTANLPDNTAQNSSWKYSFISTNPPGQTPYYASPVITVKTVPSLAGWTDSVVTCQGARVILSYGNHNGAYHYTWSDQYGVTGTNYTDTVYPTATIKYYFEALDTLTGCPAYDSTKLVVGTTPNPLLPATTYTICAPSNLTIGGAAISGYTYNWNDGHGYFSSLAQPSISPGATDIYYLTVSNTSTSCVGYDTVTVNVNLYPVISNALSPTYTICQGANQVLSDGAYNNQLHYTWNTSAGLIDTTSSITVSPAPGSTTYYFKVAYVYGGCSAYDTITVNVDTVPVINLPATSYAVCPNTSISLGSTAITGYTYLWSDGGSFTSSLASPTISPTANGNYSLTVIDGTEVAQCSATATVSVISKQAPAQQLCLVTVDSSSSSNIITWQKLDRNATDSFFIYRETSTNVYTKISSVPGDSLSEYNDLTANPNVSAYRYKISAYDTCGNESPVSDYHNTIHLQYTGSGQLIWNTYVIENDTTTPVSTFDVYRDTTGFGNFALMVELPGTQYSATDINYNIGSNTFYRVVANFAYSCTPTRATFNSVLSNVVSKLPVGINTVEGAAVAIYPNPASTELHILATGARPDRLSIYNAEGQQISERPYDIYPIDITSLPAGVYFVEIRTGADVARRSFVKM